MVKFGGGNVEKLFPPLEQHMKRSRARVPLGGQCVLLQISLRIKILDFFLNIQNYSMNHIVTVVLLNP